MAKIWEKGYGLDALIERFTVGEDYALDRRLVAADAVGSIAHALMLERIGVLTSADCGAVTTELRAIVAEALSTGFAVEREQEDSHTAIEARLVDRLGEPGKRIHTGRSRNDQVLASTRLFAREGGYAVAGALLDAAAALLELATRTARVPLAGRTHLQPAMPSTVGLWAASHAESLIDAAAPLATAIELVDRSPLGAAAGYGVPLPLDREYVADLLGFPSIHHNVVAAVSSRGLTESVLLSALELIGLILSRFAADVILFSLPEFGYVSLPAELCSGSSIMPQKRNPDAMELMRAKSAVLSSYADRTRGIVRSLVSGYNRDVQETKEPLIRGLDLTLELLAVAELTAGRLEVDEQALRRGFDAGVFATDRAMEYVAAGMPFRDAYRRVAAELPALSPAEFDVDSLIAARTSTGSPGNPDLPWIGAQIATRRSALEDRLRRIRECVGDLAGEPVSLYPGTPLTPAGEG